MSDINQIPTPWEIQKLTWAAEGAAQRALWILPSVLIDAVS